MLDAQGAVPAFVDALRLGGSTSSATRWAAASGSTSPSTTPTGSASSSPSAVSAPTSGSGPSEGIRLLQEFTEDPTRQRLVDWLNSMVHDPALVTETLIEERWALATDPETLASARRMYGRRRSRRR